MNQFADRMIRAAKLEAEVYEEVEADQSAMGQALGVVVLSSLAAGLALVGTQGAAGLLMATAGALIGWFVWALLTYLIGAKLLPEAQTEADLNQLLRTIGFSSAPGVIRIIGIVPGLNAVVSLVAAVWMLVAMVVAVRQALDYNSTWRAVGVCVIGWLVQVVLLALVMAMTGHTPPGAGAGGS
ncbi:MAG TPA: YIP1 family protein [Gammaproteobacteria bacterium]|nr:YIP1 family protein [Gammaproteobacteria bacterium]